jgi:hypothetical protein
MTTVLIWSKPINQINLTSHFRNVCVICFITLNKIYGKVNTIKLQLDAGVMEAITKGPVFGDRKLLHACVL